MIYQADFESFGMDSGLDDNKPGRSSNFGSDG